MQIPPSNTEIIFKNALNYDSSLPDTVSEGINDLISIYELLHNFGCTLSGFQFIGIIIDKSIIESSNSGIQASYFYLAVGFVLSLFTAFFCYINIYFLKTLRYENIEFVTTAMKQYNKLFLWCHYSTCFNYIFFIGELNFIVHGSLPKSYAYTTNFISLLFSITSIFLYYKLILRKQRFKCNGNIIQRNWIKES